MKNRVLIMTGASSINRPPEETDNTIEEVLDATLPSKQRYAKKYGYDLLSIRSFGSDKNNKFKDTEIGFMRALRAFEMLEYYDTVMWLDADAIITNDNYAIEDFQLNENFVFYASYDWVGKYTFSTGNFIIRKTDKTQNLFNRFLDVSLYSLNDIMQEQGTLNQIYRESNESREFFNILPHKFLGGVPNVVHDTATWRNDHRGALADPWTPDCFLAHLTGMTPEERVDILANNKLNLK